jgi:hypothetical protein
MGPRVSLAAGLLCLAMIRTGGAAGTAPAPVASKVDKVVVYSTQARVFRTAPVTLTAGPLTVGVADLPRAVLADTVKVRCKTAEVLRVEVALARERLPLQAKAKEMVDKMEALLGELRAVGDEKGILNGELQFLGSLELRTLPPPREGRAAQPEGLFVDAWRKILSWVDGRSSKIRARLLVLAGEEKRRREALHRLQVEAQGLDLSSSSDPVWRVVATLKGRPGKHQVVISYLVDQVSWLPAYDLSYDGARRTVEATYYATVRQTTGEDWPTARLRFSTGQPTHLVAVPELPTWLLGRKQDFTPQPRPRLEPRSVAWMPPAVAAPPDPVVERLRVALIEGYLSGPVGSATPEQAVAEEDGKGDRLDRPRSEMTMQKIGSLKDLKEAAESAAVPSSAAGKRAPAPTTQEPAPVLRPMADRASLARQAMPYGPAEALSVHALSATGRTVSTETVPWSDQGYSPPPLDPDSPAAGAQGYLFTLYAPGQHTVSASGLERRIPLFKRRLSVGVIHRLVPGRSSSAYLVAALMNTTGQPILRGNANLFTGSSFSGRTWLNTSLPGEKLALPLGVDDAVKVVRHLQQRTATEGVLFKDDVTEYTVEIEVANHRRDAIQAVVEDQVPVVADYPSNLKDKIQVRGFSSSEVGRPDERGKVTWRGTVGAGSVKKLAFTFQIVRPKDWELVQHED